MYPEVVVDGISLAQNTIGRVVGVVNAATLVQEILSFRLSRVRGTIGINVRTYVGEKVGFVAGFGYGGLESGQFAAVFREDFAVAGKVDLLYGRRRVCGFGVEKAR